MLEQANLRIPWAYAGAASLIGDRIAFEDSDLDWRRRPYVAVDRRACERWAKVEIGPAWELTCVYLGLDPEPLDWQPLCQGRHLDPDGEQWQWSGLADGQEIFHSSSRLVRALGESLRVVNDAIVAKRLPTLSSRGHERRLHKAAPLLREVRIWGFIRWVEVAGLARGDAWPARGTNGVPAETLEVPIHSELLRLAKLIQARFGPQYALGGRRIPRQEDIAQVLWELGEPVNAQRDRTIAAMLRPDDTPSGPRRSSLTS